MDADANFTVMKISSEVELALQHKRPVVALESTIITHGMEYPINLETALAVEQIVRDEGAIPATIAIINGQIRVGLSREEIEFVAKNKRDFVKCSRRDLSYVISQKKHASTTVATTMIWAAKAGISIFVTGGIGGVHRGAETTFDISADLIELGQTQVAVVCAGAKSILDIPKTLEYLETHGVPVVGLKTKKFPNFFTPDSGCFCSAEVQSERDAAQLVKAQFGVLNLKNGIIISNPIPEEEAANGQLIEDSIQKALKDADQQAIKGAEITPFLLKRVFELTEGKSAESNVALIKNNARVGARIAKELSSL